MDSPTALTLTGNAILDGADNNESPHQFRLVDFNVYNKQKSATDDLGSDNGSDSDNDSDEHNVPRVECFHRDTAKFVVQMFGLNELGESCSIMVRGFNPFFYVMVGPDWKPKHKLKLLTEIQARIKPYYANSIVGCTLIKRRKLYGFDNKTKHKFIKFEFTNTRAMARAADLWYTEYEARGAPAGAEGDRGGHVLKADGFVFLGTRTRLYESNVPPLLRLLHLRDISPSGWIELPRAKTSVVRNGDDSEHATTYSCTIRHDHIVSVRDKETPVPYKIMSFDIEADSSHGDFPTPIKTYSKLANNIVDYFEFYCKDNVSQFTK